MSMTPEQLQRASDRFDELYAAAFPFDVPERPVDPPWVADPEPDEDADDDQVKEFDVVEYISARRRVQRVRRRWHAAKWFLLGVTTGVVAFSVALEVAT